MNLFDRWVDDGRREIRELLDRIDRERRPSAPPVPGDGAAALREELASLKAQAELAERARRSLEAEKERLLLELERAQDRLRALETTAREAALPPREALALPIGEY